VTVPPRHSVARVWPGWVTFGLTIFAAGDELRFAIHDDEHVVGVVVHFGAALHAAVGNDDQALILDAGSSPSAS
jgi:hypothetical protein